MLKNEKVIWGIFPVIVTDGDEEGDCFEPRGVWANIITKYLLPIPIVNRLFICTIVDEDGFEEDVFKLYPYSLNKRKTWVGMIWDIYLSPFKCRCKE